MRAGPGFVAILKFLFEEALVWGTRPAEIFLRKNFGVRGHSLFQTLQTCVAGTWIGWLVAYYDLVLRHASIDGLSEPERQRRAEAALRWRSGSEIILTHQSMVDGALVLSGFCLAAAVLAVFHRIEAVRAEMKGQARFSWSNGEPIYFL